MSIAEPGVPGSTDVFARMDRADLTAVTVLAEAGLLSVRGGAVFPLAKAAEAQRAFATGNLTGKVVSRSAEPPALVPSRHPGRHRRREDGHGRPSPHPRPGYAAFRSPPRPRCPST
ncbi:zinc-binding dehydrogenase [Streptomyces sp. NPDC058469]|uniref:zinc-binding dehydrogenase n=1 Tax=Streptomyces sp. NPDC058469 TaxID=3346514 RepID=UPI00365B5432